VSLFEDAFEKDGKRISYRKVRLTPEGRAFDGAQPVQVKDAIVVPKSPRKRAKKVKRAQVKPAATPPAAAPPVVEKLKAWRLAEARRRGVPAFRILTDAALNGIAASRPSTARELLAFRHRLSTVEKYGGQSSPAARLSYHNPFEQHVCEVALAESGGW